MSTEGSRDRAARSSPVARGAWVVTTGRDVVNAVERLICGAGAAPNAARAEGFALAGGPAATLIDPENPNGHSAPTFSAAAAWVHHRIGDAGPEARRGFAAELVAGTVQEASDQCLVAHRIACALSRPCLCTLDAGVANEPAFARLPDSEQIRGVRQAAPNGFRAPREVARRAFEWVLARTGRTCGPVVTESVEDADYLLVAQGGARVAALRIAARLRERGVPCGVIGVTLVEPFPHDALSSLVLGKRAIAVIGAGPEVATAALSAWVRSSAASTPDVLVSSVGLCGDDAREYADTRKALGLDADATPSVTPALTHRKSIVLGVAPDSEWAGSFLRSFAARLQNMGRSTPLTLGRPATPVEGTATLAIGADAGGAPAAETLDVLLAPDLATLRGSRGLAALRPGGTVLLFCDPDRDPGSEAALTSAQRADLILRDLRLIRLRREAPATPEPLDSDPFDALLAGALLAAVPELRERLGVATDVQDNEAKPGDAVPVGSGADSIETLDTAKLEVQLEESTKDPGATLVPPQWTGPPAPEQTDAASACGHAWSESLRHFHLTGEGAHSTVEPPRGVPLLPLALETLEIDRQPGTYPLALDAGNHPPAAVDLGPGTVLRLYTELACIARRRLRREYTERARRLAWRLGELLGFPDGQGPAGPSARNLSGSLGGVSDSFFDAEKLSKMLPRAAAADLAPGRRERMERTWRSLSAFVSRDRAAPELIVVHPPEMRIADDGRRVRAIVHEDPLRAALGIFDSLTLIDAVRAVRIAELENRHAYDEKVHDRLFARFGWESFTSDELLALPQVVAFVSGARLRGPSLAALSELLRSGRPIHVLVEEHLHELHDSGDESLSGYHAGLGYLTVAHREAFVLQSSLGVPLHLVDGLRRMATSLRPSVALIAAPDWHAAAGPMLQLAAAHAGRATPAFLFDPSAGDTWAERFDLTGNPQAETTWPLGSVRYLDPDGREQPHEEALTFAHAAALLTAYRRHFRVIPRAAVSDAQVPIASWLELPEDQALRRLPFIWVQAGGGGMARAVLTRELAFACRDRARTWRIFCELSGTAGAPTADETATAAAGITEVPEAKPVEAGAAQIQAAGQAAVRAAMQRLVRALVDPNGTPVPETALAIASTPAAAEPAPALPAVGAPPAPKPKPPEGPYIDTPLCTTCNECINLNRRLFVYDENKQARIGDAAAGTFKELVLAAEKCPARCIHPGSPRPGDSSATEKLIARAAPFA